MKNLTLTLALFLCFVLNALAQKPIAFSKEKDDYVILVAENRTPAEATAAAVEARHPLEDRIDELQAALDSKTAELASLQSDFDIMSQIGRASCRERVLW